MLVTRTFYKIILAAAVGLMLGCNSNDGGGIITPPIGDNSISGTVTAPAGGNVQNTTVYACLSVNGNCDLTAPTTKSQKLTTTGSSANYQIGNLTTGKYAIVADKDMNGNGQQDNGDYSGCHGNASGCLAVTPPITGINVQLNVVTGGGGTGQCAKEWSADITVPTRLTNSAAACDYLLKGFVYVKSDLVIDPGVTIRADKDAIIWLEGGSIFAVGTSTAHITMEGYSPLQGFWEGIRISTIAGTLQLEYVDIKDAGQTCTSAFGRCPQAAIGGYGGGQVTLKNSSISNSYVNGASLGNELVAFSNNKFFGNRWAGIVIDADKVASLDKASDFTGGTKPNGNPYVVISTGSSTTKVATWKKLNAPYYSSGYFKIENTLTLEPGTKFIGDGAWISIDPGGTLLAIGTAAQPIVFTGATQTAGSWDGLYFSVNNDGQNNRLEYVTIEYGGGKDNSLITNGNITNYEAGIYIANSNISNSTQWGISCNTDTALITLGTGNTFSKNAYGDIEPVSNNGGCTTQ